MKSIRGHDYGLEILEAWNSGDLVLFLGAGVSIPYGVPNWSDLVVELLLPNEPSLDALGPQYRSAVGDWMSDWFDYRPVTLARQFKPARNAPIEEKIKYHATIRHALYQRRVWPPHRNDILSAVCDLIAASEAPKTKWNVRAVVTSNFDDLLEAKLVGAGIACVPHYTTRRRERTSTLPILHIHGYLPSDERRWQEIDHQQNIIFAEDDYHSLTYTSFHWAIEELTHFMRTSTILFIGCSMRDPNVRRLLDATSTPGSKHHFIFRPNYKVVDLEQAKADVQARAARVGAAPAPEADVERAIHEATRIATNGEERTFAQMGAGIIWFDEYKDVAEYLRSILAQRIRVKERPSNDPRPPLR